MEYKVQRHIKAIMAAVPPIMGQMDLSLLAVSLLPTITDIGTIPSQGLILPVVSLPEERDEMTETLTGA